MGSHVSLRQPCSFFSSLWLIFFNPDSHIWTQNSQILFQYDGFPQLLFALYFRSHPPLLQPFDTIVAFSYTLSSWRSENHQAPETQTICLLIHVVFGQYCSLDVIIGTRALFVHARIGLQSFACQQSYHLGCPLVGLPSPRSSNTFESHEETLHILTFHEVRNLRFMIASEGCYRWW